NGATGTVTPTKGTAVQVPGTPLGAYIFVSVPTGLGQDTAYLATTYAVANGLGHGGTPATGIAVVVGDNYNWPPNLPLFVGANTGGADDVNYAINGLL